jgi:hypothetical protein
LCAFTIFLDAGDDSEIYFAEVAGDRPFDIGAEIFLVEVSVPFI